MAGESYNRDSIGCSYEKAPASRMSNANCGVIIIVVIRRKMPNDINGDDYYNANATFYDGKVQAFYSDNTFFSSSENGEKTSLDIGSTKNFRSMM